MIRLQVTQIRNKSNNMDEHHSKTKYIGAINI